MPEASPWRFFTDTYDTERLKTLSVWSTIRDSDLRFRCAERACTPLEHMVHQCVYSTYGPTADTGGLFLDHAPTVYRYVSIDTLVAAESEGGACPPLAGPGAKPVTERP